MFRTSLLLPDPLTTGRAASWPSPMLAGSRAPRTSATEWLRGSRAEPGSEPALGSLPALLSPHPSQQGLLPVTFAAPSLPPGLPPTPDSLAREVTPTGTSPVSLLQWPTQGEEARSQDPISRGLCLPVALPWPP